MLVLLSDVHLTDGTSGTTINPRAFEKFGKIILDIIGASPFGAGACAAVVDESD